MDERAVSTVDLQIGLRLRARRREIGLSQEGLAERLGLTFQQVQKYEKGVNRVAAARLLAIAGALDVPVQYFYEGLELDEPSGGSSAARILTALSDYEAQTLILAFAGVPDPKVRRHIVALVTSLSVEDQEPISQAHKTPANVNCVESVSSADFPKD
jgi:transcriptional regulator with XRE-family HTH domain